MPSLRHLQSVANDLVAHSASRNNDLDGWWMPGLLVSTGAEDAEIDLLLGEGHGVLRDPGFRLAVDRLAVRFRRMVEAKGIAIADVASARLRVRVGPPAHRSFRADHLMEHDVEVACALVGRDGRIGSGFRSIRVSPHDPGVDRRSSRADPELA